MSQRIEVPKDPIANECCGYVGWEMLGSAVHMHLDNKTLKGRIMLINFVRCPKCGVLKERKSLMDIQLSTDEESLAIVDRAITVLEAEMILKGLV